MRIPTYLAWLILCAPALPQLSTAAESDVGTVLEQAGAPTVLVRAGDAIRLTCLQLNDNRDALSAAQSDLFSRCGEMSNTIVGGPNDLGYRSLQDGFNAVRQFSGEEASSQGRFATETSNRQLAGLGARMDAIRLGARALSSGLALDLQGTELFRSVADAGTTDRPMIGGGASADGDTGWAWFANGNVGFGDRDDSINESGYDYDSYGLTVGVDYAFAGGLTLGVAGGYTDYSADLDRERAASIVSAGSGGEIDSDGYSLSGFFVYGPGRTYVNGIATFGWSEFDSTRRIQVAPGPDAVGRPAGPGYAIDRALDSSTDSEQLAAQLTAGYILGDGATTTDLYAGIDYLTIDIDGFTEQERDLAGTTGTPGLALQYDDQDIDSLQTIVGITLRHAINTGFGVVLPYAGAEWRHEFDNDARAVDYRYAFGIGNINFRSPTDEPDQDFFELSVGISAQLANRLFVFAQYSASAQLDRTSANLVSFGLRGVF